MRLWDAATGTLKNTLQHTDWIWSLAYSPDGTELAIGSRDNTVSLWNAATGQLTNTLAGHTEDVMSVGYSSDGTILASGSYDGTVRLWDVSTGTLRNVLHPVGGLCLECCF